MASAADVQSPGAERRVFWTAAAVTVVLDLITKIIAEATLLRTAGDLRRGRLVSAPPGVQPGRGVRAPRGALLPLDLLHRRAGRGVRAGPDDPKRARAGDRFRQLALGLVAGGAAGNLIDRIRSGRGVVDFLDVGIGALRWPTFNVADIAVSCGAIALAISLWREDARRPEPESASAA